MQSTTSIVLALALLVGNAAAYGGSFMGSRAALSSGRVAAGRANTRMEDFGLMKGSGFGFDDLWGEGADASPLISEVATEKALSAQGLRYKMNRTDKEAEEVGSLFNLPDVDLPFGLQLRAPRVASIWEALGFAATSNNEARQLVKMEASAKAKADPTGERTKYLAKYGYPRLVGTKGIFYADQLSTDKQPMGGFGMGKSGVMFPVPDVVKEGTYGGSAGWGAKKDGKKK